MDLGLTKTSKASENRSWLANFLGIRTHDATIDRSALTEADHYPDGHLTSGIVMGQLTAGDGLYVDYDAGAGDGSETAKGLVFNTTDISSGRDIVVPIMHAGDIISTSLPTQGGMTDGGWDAAAAADLPAIVDLA